MEIEARLAAMGLALPAPPRLPGDLPGSFTWVRRHGDRLYVSGHSAVTADGALAGPFGKVPSAVPLDAAVAAARQAALAVLASVRAEIGDLDRITAWLMVSGMVNADPGYGQTTVVINGFSDLVLGLFGPERGRHARTAVGHAALPADNAVVVGAELAFA